MSDFIFYFAMALAVMIILVELWASVSVFRSDSSSGTKIRWALFIWGVPLIGLIVWGVAGPRGHDNGPQSPEHSK